MLPLAFASFLCFGVALVLVGASQAELARDLGLDMAGSGLLASLLAAGLGVGVLGSGPLVDRLPRRPLFVGAALLAAAACLAFGRSLGLAGAGALLLLLGVGMGVYETLLNAAIVELHGARAARPMSFVHAAATLGAMSGPALVAAFVARADWSASFRALGAAHLLLAAAALAAPFPPLPLRPTRRGVGLLPPGAWRTLWPFALIAFAYVGLETALTVLAVPYATGALGLPPARGLAAISAFWAGLLGGRVGLLLLRGAIGPFHLAAAGAAGAAVLALGALAQPSAVEPLFGAAGLSLGFVFPVLVALAGARAPEARGAAIGLVVGAGALGGFALPWLHGALGDRGGPALAVGSLALWSAVAAASALAAARDDRRARSTAG